jgi:hypothetical protein
MFNMQPCEGIGQGTIDVGGSEGDAETVKQGSDRRIPKVGLRDDFQASPQRKKLDHFLQDRYVARAQNLTP